VHRGLTGFILDKEITLPASGENLKIQHEGKDMGYITSFARLPVVFMGGLDDIQVVHCPFVAQADSARVAKERNHRSLAATAAMAIGVETR